MVHGHLGEAPGWSMHPDDEGLLVYQASGHCLKRVMSTFLVLTIRLHQSLPGTTGFMVPTNCLY